MGNSGIKPKELFRSGAPLPEWNQCMSAVVADNSIVNCVDVKGRTPLHRAVIDKAPDSIVSLLLKYGIENCSKKDKEGYLPLHYVLCTWNLKAENKTFRIILDAYMEGLTCKTKLGVLPIHICVQHRGDISIVKEMLDYFPDAAGEMTKNTLPLHMAIDAKCSFDVLKALIDAYPDAVYRKASNGYLPLHHLVKTKPSLEIVDYFVKLYPDAVNDKTLEGKLPLHYALEKQAPDDVVLYIAGCNLDTVSVVAFGGNYPFHIALDMHYSYDVISFLLSEYPKAAFTLDSSDVMPLRKCIKERFPNDVILMLLEANPDAVGEIDEYERYAIHYAASRNYSDEVMGELIRIFPSSIRLCDKNGQLPLHIALVHEDNFAVIKNLITYYPEGTLVADDKGYLPIHYAIENQYGTDIIVWLLDAGPTATEFLCKGRLALHMAIEFKHCFNTIEAVLNAYTDAISKCCESADEKLNKILPLHLAIERQLGEDIQFLLLEAYHDDGSGGVAISTDRHGLFPIHYAVKYHSTLPIVTKLLNMFPEIVEMRYNYTNNKLLIHYAADVGAPYYAIAEILIRTMPFSYINGAPNHKHFYTWTYVVSQTGDRYYEAVDVVLRNYKYEYIKRLSDAPDEEGRKAVDIATPRCKNEILSRLYYFDRYELQQELYVHRSIGCMVRLALDHKAGLSTATTVGMPNRSKPALVALKFMKFQHEFSRELSVRSEVQFDDQYVIGFIRCHDGDADSEYRLETIRKGVSEYPYCIVMVAGQRSLEDILRHEYLAGKEWDRIREYSYHVVKCVHHMHAKGFLHGDLKPMNILRLPGELTAHNEYYHRYSMRLCDMGGAMSFRGGLTTGIKVSSAYIPPEMVYAVPYTQRNKFDGATACVRLAPNSINLMNQQALIEMKDPYVVVKHFFSTAYSLVIAASSQDMWSLGVILYEMFSGTHLFIKSDEDSIDEKSLNMLAEWSDQLKNEKMAKISDLYARNLVYQLLYKDPEQRPSADKLLEHPFLTQIPCARVPQEPPSFDVYICCRSDIELDCQYADYMASILIDNFNLRVHVEKHDRVISDTKFVDAFCNVLAQSRIFIPIFSNEAVRNPSIPEYNWEKLSAISPVDYLLLSCRLAMELYYMQMVEFVFPVLVGDHAEPEVVCEYEDIQNTDSETFHTEYFAAYR